MSRLKTLEQQAWDAPWPEAVVIDGEVRWRPDDGFGDLGLMNRLVGWEVGVTDAGWEWVKEGLADHGTVLLLPRPLSKVSEKALLNSYPGAAVWVLGPDAFFDISDVVRQVRGRLHGLPSGPEYVLLVTGPTEQLAVAIATLTDMEITFKLAVYDPMSKVHFEVH